MALKQARMAWPLVATEISVRRIDQNHQTGFAGVARPDEHRQRTQIDLGLHDPAVARQLSGARNERLIDHLLQRVLIVGFALGLLDLPVAVQPLDDRLEGRPVAD